MKSFNKNNYTSKAYRKPEYPTDGDHAWWAKGYIQAVRQHDKQECFYIDIWEERENSRWCENFQITIPYDLDVEPEPGDYIQVEGRFRTWTKEDGKKLELVATSISEMYDETGSDILNAPAENDIPEPEPEKVKTRWRGSF